MNPALVGGLSRLDFESDVGSLGRRSGMRYHQCRDISLGQFYKILEQTSITYTADEPPYSEILIQ